MFCKAKNGETPPLRQKTKNGVDIIENKIEYLVGIYKL